MLRARTRWLAQSERERHCGTWCVEHVDHEPYIEVRHEAGQARASYRGLLSCTHVWTCPVCSHKLRTKKALAISAAVRGMGGRWQMLTVTVRHHGRDDLKGLLRAMSRAWRRCKQGGRMQRIFAERVTASVRATEITYGENGWHPHFHVLLRTEEWDTDEKLTLLQRWQTAIRGELGQAYVPSDAHALSWSDGFASDDGSNRERYLVKLGLELAGASKRTQGLSQWQVAERATLGDQQMLRLWGEFQTATRGRRMIELDDRAAAGSKLQLEADAALLVEPTGQVKEPFRIRLARDDVRAFRRIERRHPHIFATVLRAAETEGSSAVAAWVRYARGGEPEWPS